MSEKSASLPGDQPRDLDEVEALVDELEVHGFDIGIGTSGDCSLTSCCTDSC